MQKNADGQLPEILDPCELGRDFAESYRNVALGTVNDHEIRMSVMTGQFDWHRHPNSDETFLSVDGELAIEFEEGEIVLRPGQLLTVPAGKLHRTRALGSRSVNLTFERSGAATQFAKPVGR